MSVLYKADPVRGQRWKDIFARARPDLDFHIWPETGPLDEVEYLVAWTVPPFPLTDLPRLRAVFSVGAGVSQFDMAAIPTHVPLIRLVDPAVTDNVAEYVATGVLALHRDLPAYVAQQARQDWRPVPAVAAADRRVGFLGLGAMAQGAIARLAPFGFPLAGWSRSRHEIAGVACRAGPDELGAFLRQTDILVCLLPLTDQTRGILDDRLFAQLPPGSALLQAGRGEQLDPAALIRALDSGHLRAAMLDVTTPEPLPPGDPLWRHRGILITPHIASQNRPETAAAVVLANLTRLARGEPPLGLVDRARGY